MALTTTTRKQFAAWLVSNQAKAAAFIDNLVDELETRITTAEGGTTGLDTRLDTAEGEIDTLQSGMTAVTNKANVQRFPGAYAGDALAADVVGETPFAVALTAGTVAGIDLVFGGNITADDTDYATITVRHRTGAGAGTATVIATIVTKITNGTGNITGQARIRPTTTAQAVIAGDRFTYQIEKAASGVLVPAMSLTVVETLT